MAPLICPKCNQPLTPPLWNYERITVTAGDCAEYFEIDIGNSKSREYYMHDECASVFKVTARIVGIKTKTGARLWSDTWVEEGEI